MALSVREIAEKLEKKPNSDTISVAGRLEDRLNFHLATNISEGQCAAPLADFLGYADRILAKREKSQLFRSFLRLPVPTAELADSICVELKKVFDGQNATREFQFSDPNLLDDWNWYSTDIMNEHKRWMTEGFDNFRHHINSVIVVDLPKEQKGDKPEPYFYWLNIKNVVCYETDNGGCFRYIVFRTGEEKTYNVIDDTSYRTVRYDEDRKSVSVIHEAEHGLGYCPACFFWSDGIEKNPDIKENPFVKELDNFDYLLFKIISKRIADLGGEYPIYWHYEADKGCDYEDVMGNRCDNGFLRNAEGQFVVDAMGDVMNCPVCNNRQFRGAGSVINVPIPSENQPDLSNPIGIVTTPVPTLQQISKDILDLKNDIYQSIVGYEGVDTGTAMNELQIKSNFENRRTVLNNLKLNFEKAQKFAEETVCRLRYGEDFIDCTIDYGTEFYIYTVEQLRDRYNKAKSGGASNLELDYLADQIIYTENKTNPIQLQRMLMLKQIEPYRHLGIGDIKSMLSDGVLDPELVKIKLNFNNLIDRFERENALVTEFGLQLPFRERIDKIIETIKKY